MEITYQRRGNNIDDCLLSQQQKTQFYDTKRRVVVVVKCELKQRRTKKIISLVGGGIVVDKRGYILTVAALVPNERERTSQFCVEHFNGGTYPVMPVHTDYNQGLALLKLVDKPNDDCDYAEFANETIEVGIQTFTIGHSGCLYFNYVEGYVCYECSDPMTPSTKCRSVDDVRKSSSAEVPADLEDDLPLIQVKNPSKSSNLWGCPLFNSSGHVIGIYLFSLAGFDWALHFESLKKFLESALSQE